MIATFPEGLRVGCVGYLNARPLVYGMEHAVRFDHPAVLAQDLAAGRLDVALVPAVELFSHSEYAVVDGISISSDGDVYSVCLARLPGDSTPGRVLLDPASLSSATLLRVLLEHYEGANPEYAGWDGASFPTKGEGLLLIGSQAIEFRLRHGDRFDYWDLGAQWKVHTGLPFVFALWMIRPEVAKPEVIADALRSAAARGLAARAEIAARDRDPVFALHYLMQHIDYRCEDSHWESLRKYAAMLGVQNCAKRI